MRTLDGPGIAIEVRDRVVVASKCQWLIGEESLKDLDGLFQAFDARPCTFESDACLFILRAEPSRSNPKLESSI